MIGIPGWTDPLWRSVIYPNGLRQKDEVRYAWRQFQTIGINGVSYGLRFWSY
jgi:uncharacterized protein YecE (DUF72 family)